jgi:hypothetical protein
MRKITKRSKRLSSPIIAAFVVEILGPCLGFAFPSHNEHLEHQRQAAECTGAIEFPVALVEHKVPIASLWFALVLPALLLNYAGQAASFVGGLSADGTSMYRRAATARARACRRYIRSAAAATGMTSRANFRSRPRPAGRVRRRRGRRGRPPRRRRYEPAQRAPCRLRS